MKRRIGSVEITTHASEYQEVVGAVVRYRGLAVACKIRQDVADGMREAERMAIRSAVGMMRAKLAMRKAM